MDNGGKWVMAGFGQTDFGRLFDRLWPALGLTDFGQTDFGKIGVLVFGPIFPPKPQTLNPPKNKP